LSNWINNIYFQIMVVRMRHTRAHTKNRRSHHKLENGSFVVCSHCKVSKPKHVVCYNCGTYRGRNVVDMVGVVAKKEAKRKEKQKALGKDSEKGN